MEFLLDKIIYSCNAQNNNLYHKRRKFGVAKVWRIWRIRQTFIRQLTMRPRDVLLTSW